MPLPSKTRRIGLVLLVAGLVGAAALALAQSGISAFSLNSPASFPVDI